MQKSGKAWHYCLCLTRFFIGQEAKSNISADEAPCIKRQKVRIVCRTSAPVGYNGNKYAFYCMVCYNFSGYNERNPTMLIKIVSH